MFFVRNCVAERKSYCIGSFTSELLETDCRVLPTLPFKEEYNIMLPLYRKKVHRKVVGKWYCQILSAGSQLNTIKLLQTVCSMRILLYFIAACEEQGSAKMYDYISYLYYPAKVHVALLQFWTWCLLEVVFANGWVPLLIVVTRPSGGHCRQSWDAVGVNSPSYLLSHHVTSSLLQNWKLVMYMIYVFIYIYISLSPFLYYTYTCDILWFSSSWFPSCFFSWSSISQMIQVVAATPPVTVTDMKDIYRVGVSCCQIGSVKSSSWDWGLRVDVIDPLIH